MNNETPISPLMRAPPVPGEMSAMQGGAGVCELAPFLCCEGKGETMSKPTNNKVEKNTPEAVGQL